MASKVDEQEILKITADHPFLAIAEYAEGLTCSVYAEGRQLGPWAGQGVGELLKIEFPTSAIVTSQTTIPYVDVTSGIKIQYFIFDWDPANESFRERGTLYRG